MPWNNELYPQRTPAAQATGRVMTKGPETSHICPSCKSDVSSFYRDGKPPSFCLDCRFPLMRVAGKYELLRECSEGGFGLIYEARHTQLTRDPLRAIKIIKPEILQAHGVKERFAREVQVTSALSQKNQHIVRIFDDFGEIPKLGHFYVMEFLQGKPLSDWLEEEGTLPLDVCFHLYLQLCDAMHAAHAEGVIHRDLKPENFIITKQLRDPHFLKVIDFGIAKPLHREQDSTKLTQGSMGTPLYMSPEQCTNQDVDERTDIYAMGCILYELLTGSPPFTPATHGGESEFNAMTLLTLHLMESPLPLSETLPEGRLVPAGLQSILDRTLAKKPEDRFSTVLALEEAFREALETPKTLGRQDASREGALPTGVPISLAGAGQSTLPDAPVANDLMLDDDIPTMLEKAPDISEFMPPKTAPSGARVSLDTTTEERPPQDTSRRGLVLAVLAFIALACGGFVAFKSTQKQDPTKGAARATPRATKANVTTLTKRKAPAPTQPDASTPRPTRAPGRVTPPRTAPKRTTPKRIVPKRVSPKRIAPRRPKPKRTRPRRVLRGRFVAGCPRKSGYYWTHIRLARAQSSKLSLRIRPPARGRIERKGSIACVGSRRKQAQLSLTGPPDTFVDCYIQLHKHPAKIRIKMQNKGGIEPSLSHYCVQP